MPFPKTTDVGKIRRFIRRHHPDWPEKREVAAALNAAREAGADIPPAPKKRTLKRRNRA